MSDELDRFASDEGEEESEDVEAHRRHGGSHMTDDVDDSDDVEAHRRHGGSHMTDDGDDSADVEAHRFI